MTTEHTDTLANDARQLKNLLAKIASTADLMSTIAARNIVDGNEATDDLVMIDHLSKTVGWLADYGTNLVGGGQGFKGPKAEDWMLPTAE